jgi:hypothetical protein
MLPFNPLCNACRYCSIAVQQLLLKGLVAPSTAAATLQLIATLADVLAVQVRYLPISRVCRSCTYVVHSRFG